jgi:hypothetical protein
MKAGIQSRFNYRTESYERPGGVVFRDNGGPLEAGLCDPTSAGGAGCFRLTEYPPYSVHENAYSVGFYIQDRWWTPLPQLTVVPGLRFDYGHTSDRNGDTVSSLWGFGPRLAVVADLTRDGRNVLSAAYGRSNEVISLLPAANLDSSDTSQQVVKEWEQSTHMFSKEISRTGGPGGVIIDPDLKTPHTDELTLSARRQVFTSTLAGIDYTYKRISNVWDGVEINQIWDPSGSRVIDWVDPTKMKRKVFRYTTPDGNHRTYQGVDLYAEGRPTKNWDFRGSYTLSWTYGPGATEFDQITPDSQYLNPRTYRYYDGYLREDVRHTMKAFAAYRIGPVNIGANLLYQSGNNPRTKFFYSAQDGDFTRFRSPLGTEPGSGNDIKQISEFRLPDYMRTDVRVTVDLIPSRFNHRLTLIADIFNVLNQRAAIELTDQDLDEFGQVSDRQAPFRLQLAVNLVY